MPTPQRDTPGPQQIVRALHDIGLADTVIARLVCCSPGTIWRIRHGEESGRNLAPYLYNLAIVVEANEDGYTVQRGMPVRRDEGVTSAIRRPR